MQYNTKKSVKHPTKKLQEENFKKVAKHISGCGQRNWGYTVIQWVLNNVQETINRKTIRKLVSTSRDVVDVGKPK